MLPNRPRAPEPDVLAPQTLSKYRLLGRLARGGMAEVFLARTGIFGFERLLVLKRIRPELAGDTAFVRMFLDEARIAATLHHANIVRVFEVDMAEGQVFYVMEHLHGHDLATVLRRLVERATAMPLGNAVAIVAAVAAGLHHAHQQCASDGQPLGIVHRDVAPSNVIVTYDGGVKLIDFGIAKAAGNLNRTQFGLFKGKLPYASPEQCRCEPVDRRSDVFSLGAVLYELTTGQRLFTADSDHELLRVVSEAVVPQPRLRDKAYPRELEAIVLRALAASPDERHASARGLRTELDAFAAAHRLDISALSLARLMESLFGRELGQWRTAERAGVTLEQHVVTTVTAKWPSAVGGAGVAGAAAASGAAEHGRPMGSGATDARDTLPDVSASAGDAPDTLQDVSASAGAAPDTLPDLSAPAGAAPASESVAVVASPPPSARRSQIARYAAIALVAAVLVAAGAIGALWWIAQ